jgi:hypothetical protein
VKEGDAHFLTSPWVEYGHSTLNGREYLARCPTCCGELDDPVYVGLRPESLVAHALILHLGFEREYFRKTVHRMLATENFGYRVRL